MPSSDYIGYEDLIDRMNSANGNLYASRGEFQLALTEIFSLQDTDAMRKFENAFLKWQLTRTEYLEASELTTYNIEYFCHVADVYTEIGTDSAILIATRSFKDPNVEIGSIRQFYRETSELNLSNTRN